MEFLVDNRLVRDSHTATTMTRASAYYGRREKSQRQHPLRTSAESINRRLSARRPADPATFPPALIVSFCFAYICLMLPVAVMAISQAATSVNALPDQMAVLHVDVTLFLVPTPEGMRNSREGISKALTGGGSTAFLSLPEVVDRVAQSNRKYTVTITEQDDASAPVLGTSGLHDSVTCSQDMSQNMIDHTLSIVWSQHQVDQQAPLPSSLSQRRDSTPRPWSFSGKATLSKFFPLEDRNDPSLQDQAQGSIYKSPWRKLAVQLWEIEGFEDQLHGTGPRSPSKESSGNSAPRCHRRRLLQSDEVALLRFRPLQRANPENHENPRSRLPSARHPLFSELRLAGHVALPRSDAPTLPSKSTNGYWWTLKFLGSALLCGCLSCLAGFVWLCCRDIVTRIKELRTNEETVLLPQPARYVFVNDANEDLDSQSDGFQSLEEHGSDHADGGVRRIHYEVDGTRPVDDADREQTPAQPQHPEPDMRLESPRPSADQSTLEECPQEAACSLMYPRRSLCLDDSEASAGSHGHALVPADGEALSGGSGKGLSDELAPKESEDCVGRASSLLPMQAITSPHEESAKLAFGTACRPSADRAMPFTNARHDLSREKETCDTKAAERCETAEPAANRDDEPESKKSPPENFVAVGNLPFFGAGTTEFSSMQTVRNATASSHVGSHAFPAGLGTDATVVVGGSAKPCAHANAMARGSPALSGILDENTPSPRAASPRDRCATHHDVTTAAFDRDVKTSAFFESELDVENEEHGKENGLNRNSVDGTVNGIPAPAREGEPSIDIAEISPNETEVRRPQQQVDTRFPLATRDENLTDAFPLVTFGPSAVTTKQIEGYDSGLRYQPRSFEEKSMVESKGIIAIPRNQQYTNRSHTLKRRKAGTDLASVSDTTDSIAASTECRDEPCNLTMRPTIATTESFSSTSECMQPKLVVTGVPQPNESQVEFPAASRGHSHRVMNASPEEKTYPAFKENNVATKRCSRDQKSNRKLRAATDENDKLNNAPRYGSAGSDRQERAVHVLETAKRNLENSSKTTGQKSPLRRSLRARDSTLQQLREALHGPVIGRTGGLVTPHPDDLEPADRVGTDSQIEFGSTCESVTSNTEALSNEQFNSLSSGTVDEEYEESLPNPDTEESRALSEIPDKHEMGDSSTCWNVVAEELAIASEQVALPDVVLSSSLSNAARHILDTPWTLETAKKTTRKARIRGNNLVPRRIVLLPRRGEIIDLTNSPRDAPPSDDAASALELKLSESRRNASKKRKRSGSGSQTDERLDGHA
jgi:hypothetical protein